MEEMFAGARGFNQDVSQWNTSSVVTMRAMFRNAFSFEGKHSRSKNGRFDWDVGKVYTMTDMFNGAWMFNGRLAGWDTSSVLSMDSMFQSASVFKGLGLETWDVSKVKDFGSIFQGATSFGADLGAWQTGAANNMAYMFSNCVSLFASNFSEWDVSKVFAMQSMFSGASKHLFHCKPGSFVSKSFDKSNNFRKYLIKV